MNKLWRNNITFYFWQHFPQLWRYFKHKILDQKINAHMKLLYHLINSNMKITRHTLRAETFAGRNFRVFREFRPFSRKFMPLKISNPRNAKVFSAKLWIILKTRKLFPFKKNCFTETTSIYTWKSGEVDIVCLFTTTHHLLQLLLVVFCSPMIEYLS